MDGQPTRVKLTGDAPVAFLLPGTRDVVRITAVLDHWREWIGVLDGEPERDVWHVETARGTCELHGLGYPKGDEEPERSWILFRWDD
jgi:hypothetical protein